MFIGFRLVEVGGISGHFEGSYSHMAPFHLIWFSIITYSRLVVCCSIQYFPYLFRCVESCPFADILFRVGNESIGAHKVILSARCPFFARMFKSKWKDRKFVSLRKNTVRVFFITLVSYLIKLRLSLAFFQ